MKCTTGLICFLALLCMTRLPVDAAEDKLVIGIDFEKFAAALGYKKDEGPEAHLLLVPTREGLDVRLKEKERKASFIVGVWPSVEDAQAQYKAFVKGRSTANEPPAALDLGDEALSWREGQFIFFRWRNVTVRVVGQDFARQIDELLKASNDAVAFGTFAVRPRIVGLPEEIVLLKDEARRTVKVTIEGLDTDEPLFCCDNLHIGGQQPRGLQTGIPFNNIRDHPLTEWTEPVLAISPRGVVAYAKVHVKTERRMSDGEVPLVTGIDFEKFLAALYDKKGNGIEVKYTVTAAHRGLEVIARAHNGRRLFAFSIGVWPTIAQARHAHQTNYNRNTAPWKGGPFELGHTSIVMRGGQTVFFRRKNVAVSLSCNESAVDIALKMDELLKDPNDAVDFGAFDVPPRIVGLPDEVFMSDEEGSRRLDVTYEGLGEDAPLLLGTTVDHNWYTEEVKDLVIHKAKGRPVEERTVKVVAISRKGVMAQAEIRVKRAAPRE